MLQSLVITYLQITITIEKVKISYIFNKNKFYHLR